MKVSFVMPVRNCSAFLAESIRSLINQNLKNIEIIILDDCSTDSSWDIIKYFQKKDKRIRAYQITEHRGAGFCRNEGNKYAKSDVICVADAGDVNHPNRARTIYKYFQKNEVDIFASGVALIDAQGKDIYQEFPRYTGAKGEKPSISHPTMAYRKKIPIRYRENSLHTDQYERFILEANTQGLKFGFINSILVKKLAFQTTGQRDINSAHKVKKKIYQDYGIPLPTFLR